MKVYVLWHGGSNYACPDVRRDIEEFSSLKSAKDSLQARADFDPYYPCVDSEACEMHIFLTDPRGTDQEYPDRVLRLGPRGGVICEQA